ncbi:hypothetical protein GCM10023310_16070 [Paenibacillus vulneris]|uniref:Phosphotransferase n=1 Tax=Paenibacillus vulneris TaxID=1133364 RepID=A0ABW3UL00_9BACL
MDQQQAIQSAVRKAYFHKDQDIRTKPVPYGVNNTTCYVLSGEQKYVFRIYDNRHDEQPIQFELNVLASLKRQDLSFEVPAPVHNQEGQWITRLDNGKLGVLFHCIPGERPRPEDAYRFGRAAGELSVALGSIEVSGKPPYRGGSYHLYEVHPLISEEMLHESLSRPADPEDALAAEFMLQEVVSMEKKKESFSRMPHQLVHGDLALSNMLIHDGRISGILDFEFCSPDVRAMELAVGLMSFVQEESSFLSVAESIISGYSEQASLTTEEIGMLPSLIRLRYIGSYIHHLGRYAAGVGAFDAARKRLHSFLKLSEALVRTEEALLQLGSKYLAARS